MSSRQIFQEFTFQPGVPALPPVTLDYAWSNFMNTYAVWSENRNNITIRRSINLPQGYYFVTGAVDNSGSVSINDQIVNLYNFDVNIIRTVAANNTRIYHTGGLMSISISAVNFGGPRGVAVTISNSISPTQVGDLLWSTRSSIAGIGRYQITMPFRAEISAYAWGAGGGGGGMDAGTQGGIGSPGLYNTTFFTVDKEDVLEVFVGTGGLGGGSNSGSAPGGPAGSSRLNVNGDGTKSFNGGSGTSAGPRPYSGGGGGGGGATGILVNDSPVLIAGAGGGGGGAGNDKNGATQYARRDASITKNAIGVAGSDYRGENGQAKGGDGGGAGGGGGGYPGGQGGAVAGGDASGFAGQCGGNFPIFSPNIGFDSPYYKSGFAGGGARGGGNGQSGRVVLLIKPLSLNSVKISGVWKQIDESFVKVGGVWKEVGSIFVKVDNSWRKVENSGIKDLVLSETAGNYGISVRSYS